MKISERKLKILEAIIKDYIETAEPVGSRSISKKYDLGVGAATIRNEMSDLEELGYLIQPHTSAGRIPSKEGYELYVNQFLKGHEIDISAKDSIDISIMSQTSKVQDRIEHVLKVLSELTNYISVAMIPEVKDYKLSHLQLVPIDKAKIMLVLVAQNGYVKNVILDIVHSLTGDQLHIISKILSEKLKGFYVKDIDANVIKFIKKEVLKYSGALDNTLENIFEALKKNFLLSEDLDLLYFGSTKILDFPEFNDIVKAKEFLDMMEEKNMIMNLFNQPGIKKDNVNIIIGSDGKEILKECSLITATYQISENTIGKIGIIGPKRMDYEKVYSLLNYISDTLKKPPNK